MSSIKNYKDPKARQAYINKWTKEHYDSIKGFRPIRTFSALNESMFLLTLTSNDFLYGGTTKQPFKIWNSLERVHAPRSLLKRARIMVDKVTREIKGTSAAYTSNESLK